MSSKTNPKRLSPKIADKPLKALKTDRPEVDQSTDTNLPIAIDVNLQNDPKSYPLVPTTDSRSFESYLRSIRNAPALTPEEEWNLAYRLREYNDLEAAQKLVFCNLRYVVAIAKTYHGYGLSLPDLVQEGSVGLMRAVRRFDADKKVKLMTFASHWIRAEIHEFIIRNWRIVKMATTKAQRKLFFKLRSSKSSLDWLNEDQAKQIAENLDVNIKDVYQMEGRMSQTDTSFDTPDEDDENTTAIAKYLPDTRYDPEKIVAQSNDFELQKQTMLNGLDSLDERSREIVYERWLSDKKVTLKDLSEKYQISLERVRQIEAKALQQLRQKIEQNL